MKNIVLLILLVIITFSYCYSQTVRIKNLPSTNDSLKANDYLVTDEVSSGEVKKLTVEAIRKGLPAATTNQKGLFSAADKKIISKILYSVSGSDTNLTAFGNWSFGPGSNIVTLNTIQEITAGKIFSDYVSVHGGLIISNKDSEDLTGNELSFNSLGELFYSIDSPGGYTIDTAATKAWVREQNFGTGSGISEIVLELKGSIDPMENNQLGWYYLDTNGVRYPFLYSNFNFPYVYTARDTFPTLTYLKNVMSSYLNPCHFRKFGSPDSLEIVDSLFKGTLHGNNLSGTYSDIIYYSTNSVALSPTSNIYYVSASATETMPYKHQVTVYNTSSSYTVTLVHGLAFRLKNGSNVVLGENDTIVLDYDGRVWRQIGGSDNQ